MRQERPTVVDAESVIDGEVIGVHASVRMLCRTITSVARVKEARVDGVSACASDNALLGAAAMVLHMAAEESGSTPANPGGAIEYTTEHAPKPKPKARDRLVGDVAAEDLVSTSDWQDCGVAPAGEREVAVVLSDGTRLTASTDGAGRARVDLATVAPHPELLRDPVARVYVDGRLTNAVDVRGSEAHERWRRALAPREQSRTKPSPETKKTPEPSGAGSWR